MSATASINFILDKGSATSTALATTLETLLGQHRAELNPGFSKPQRYYLREPLRHADINVHLDIPVYADVPWAHVNVIIKDAARWSDEWEPLMDAFDHIIPLDLLSSSELLVGLKQIFQLVTERRPTKGVVHCPPILHPSDCPPISIVTPTYNRKKLIDIAFHNLLATDYPADKIEWVVIEDSEQTEDFATEEIMNFQIKQPKIAVKYIPIQGRMSIGQKRNIAIEHSTHEIILFMDDDDHYPTTSFRRRVAWLLKGRKGVETTNDISVCTTIALYDLIRGVSAVNVPPWGMSLGKRISEATLTFRKSAWLERKFEDVSISEGEAWIKGREHKCIEMPPQQIIVAFSHKNNVSTRRIPPSDIKEISCFWGFPREYLIFIHELAGMDVEEEGKKKNKVK